MTTGNLNEWIEDAVVLYKNGNTIKRVAQNFNVSKSFMRSKLKERTKLRLRGTEYIFNDGYFDKIDSGEKAYWLGFIAADGSVLHGRIGQKKLTISLSSKDKEHLIKFNEAINSNKPIYSKKTFLRKTKKYYGGVWVYYSSDKLCKNILDLKLRPKNQLSLSNIPSKLVSHFIRGYFDGDGCIYIKKRNNKLQFTSCNKNFLEEIKRVFDKELQCSHGIFNDIIYSLVYHRKMEIYKIMEYLYSNSTVQLERKRKQFECGKLYLLS